MSINLIGDGVKGTKVAADIMGFTLLLIAIYLTQLGTNYGSVNLHEHIQVH